MGPLGARLLPGLVLGPGTALEPEPANKRHDASTKKGIGQLKHAESSLQPSHSRASRRSQVESLVHTRDADGLHSIRQVTVLALLILMVPLGSFPARAGAVSAVGQNNYEQSLPPAGLSDAVAVAAGRDFSLALTQRGTVVGWGMSRDGRSSPPPSLTGVVTLSAGIVHALALKSDGTVTGWGFHGNELLTLPDCVTNVLAVAAGGFHSLALRRDGTVVGWGFHGNGRTTPPSTLTDVIAIDAGRDHSVALKANGTVVAWGLNDAGQTVVPDGLNEVIAIAAGENHTLALKRDGTVVAWGNNLSGQSSVPAGLSSVTAIAAGSTHSLALKADGSVVGWGDNSSGQLNLAGHDIRAIAARGSHSLALRGSGPQITAHPLSQTVLAGASVTFSTAAGGSGNAFQWFFNGVALSGATDSTLTLNEVSKQQAGLYSVQVSSSAGSQVSANAVLVVRGLQQLASPESTADGRVRLTFGDQNGDLISAPNATRYAVEVSSDLSHWSAIPEAPVLVQGRLVVETAAAADGGNQFFRVVEK